MQGKTANSLLPIALSLFQLFSLNKAESGKLMSDASIT
jgi:hypothetical protein